MRRTYIYIRVFSEAQIEAEDVPRRKCSTHPLISLTFCLYYCTNPFALVYKSLEIHILGHFQLQTALFFRLIIPENFAAPLCPTQNYIRNRFRMFLSSKIHSAATNLQKYMTEDHYLKTKTNLLIRNYRARTPPYAARTHRESHPRYN